MNYPQIYGWSQVPLWETLPNECETHMWLVKPAAYRDEGKEVRPGPEISKLTEHSTVIYVSWRGLGWGATPNPRFGAV